MATTDRIGQQKISRKEREKYARKEEILKAARELFARKGYHNTTLEEIAQHADFGKGTIYNYFRSKEELFYGIIDKLTFEMLHLAKSSVMGTDSGAREKLTAYAREMMSYSRKNSDLFQIIMREMHRLNAEEHDARLKQFKAGIKKVWAILAQPIRAEMKTGKIKARDALKVAALFDSMIRFYFFKQVGKLRSRKEDETDEAVEFVVSIFFDGIAGQKSKG